VIRADIFLVDNGYYTSRARAQAAIKAGLVTVDGRRLKKPSEKLNDAALIQARDIHPWVGRGGVKLAHGLQKFSVDPKNKICLDIGASTGGFSDVLNQNGAKIIYAVDVGEKQLHPTLQNLPNIISMEKTDARNLKASAFIAPPQLIVCDASFISAAKVLKCPLALSANHAELITLVKPQFEVGKAGLGRGGIVRSKSLALQALSSVERWITAQGWKVIETIDSPIKGGNGNHEYLLYARNF